MDREEAIKIVRKNIPHLGLGATEMTEALESLIPELRESEDERMMREFNDWLCEEIECRTNDLRDEKDRRTLNMLCYILTKVKDWLKKQQERKPISAAEVLARAGLKPYKDGNQWCILAGDNIQEGICGFGDTIEDALYEFLKEILDLRKEQKPAWSEEDEDKIMSIKNLITTGKFADTNTIRIIWDMLESLRPCPSRKLSEEQIYTLERICSGLHLRASDDAHKLDEIIEQLKKLM